jgi:hypothetical protein
MTPLIDFTADAAACLLHAAPAISLSLAAGIALVAVPLACFASAVWQARIRSRRMIY